MAGKKRKDMQQQSQQPQKKQQQHRVPLDSSDVDSVASPEKRARAPAPKLHQSQEKTISSDLSSKIIREALKQQKEILEEESREQSSKISFSDVLAPRSFQEENDDDEEDIDAYDGFSDTLSQYDGGELEIDEEDEKILATFMPKETGPQLTLADIILQKIKERDAEVAVDAQERPKLDSKIIDLYKGVGQFLSRYTNGKIPKAFKHISALELWEDVLYLTEPQNWSANAMYQATRIFSSKNTKRVQTFYQNMLLPRVRDNIRKNKRLHFALY